MSLNFQCPSCMGVLQFEGGDSLFQNCRHCKGNIIVPSDVVHKNENQKKQATRQTVTETRDHKLAQIQHELDGGRKIEAIKIFRESFGTDLSTAKDAVEAMQYGGRMPGGNLTRTPGAAAAQKSATLKKPTPAGCSPAVGKIVSVIIQIVVFLAIAYWFFS